MVQKQKPPRPKLFFTKSDKFHKTPLAMEPSPLAHPLYTTAEVAHALRLSIRTILRAIVSGQLEARKVGKLYLIARDAVQRFWESLPLATEAPKTVGRPKREPSPPAATGVHAEASPLHTTRPEGTRRQVPPRNTPTPPRGKR